MTTIQFNTVVDQEQVIRPPNGIKLPEGEIEVTIRPKVDLRSATDPLAATRDWLLNLATEAEKDKPDLPSDLAEKHDFYAHGKPKS